MFRNPFRDMDAKKLRRSSDILKKQNDYQKIVNFRLNVVTIVTVLIFVGIAARLIDIQIRQKDEYAVKLEAYTSKKQVSTTPRGQIYDRKGNAVAKTVSAINITYFKPSTATYDEQWELAKKFSEQFDVSAQDMTLRDLQDCYIELHTNEEGKKDKANSLLSSEELKLGNDEVYRLKLQRITQAMVDEALDQETRAAWIVYLAMDVYNLNNQENTARVILEDVDSDKVAYLTEHKSDYKGFDVDFGSWKREYPYGDSLRDIMGQVTTDKQGLPSELKEFYQAKGYALNDRVGKSGIEQQYEDLLSGTRKVSTVKFDEEEGTAILTEVNPGKKGYDVNLTVNMDLQQKTDDLLKSILEKNKGSAQRPDMSKLFVSLMNPKTGEIYAMSGALKNEDGTVINYASGNYLEGYTPGSIVKGATVYMGLNEGVVTPTEIIVDEPMNIKGTPTKASYNNYGPVNAVTALQKSSNIYMYNIAIRLGGARYASGQPLMIEDPTSTFKLMREYYSMFGLGTLTGLDVPNEQLGFTGYSVEAGKLLDFATGQYDNYTPIQLLQYVSTIANDGTKVKPRLVSGAYGVNSESLVYVNEPEVQSTIFGNIDYLNTVQEGFRACVTSGFCGSKINSVGHDVAAKTGTAEVSVLNADGKTTHDSTNASLIGYAPYDNPEVAFVCSAPTSSNVSGGLADNICYSEIMPAVLQYYFDSK